MAEPVGVPYCFTLMLSLTPPPLTVMVAVRSDVEGLAAALTLTVPSPEPEAGETVNQVALLRTVQLVLELTENVSSSPPDTKKSEFEDTLKGPLDCVTLIFALKLPPLMVMVAVRSHAEELAAALTLTVPLPLPEAGETVNQLASLLTVQLALNWIVNVCSLTSDEKLSEFVDTLKGLLACVTLMVRVMPSPLTVTVAVRSDVKELIEDETVIVLSPEPEVGETESHDSLLLTFQRVLEVMENDFCSLEYEKLNDSSDTFREGSNSPCVMLIVCVIPSPLTVIVAVRWNLTAFSIAVIVTVPLPEPECVENSSQPSASSSQLTVQLVLDVTVNDASPPENGKASESGDTSNVGEGSDFSHPVIHVIPRKTSPMNPDRVIHHEVVFELL
jgi:hypothetical protein